MEELPLEVARSLTPVDKHLATYGDARVFYVGIDYKVDREDKYFYNGVNYRLVTVVPENGQWKIAQSADAPVDILVTLGLGFSSAAEQISATIHQARHEGLAINAQGEVLERFADLTPTTAEQTEGGATIMAWYHTKPSTIRVALSHQANLQFYECEGEPTCIRLVNFTYYQKNGLGLEWSPSWHSESLRAGALAFKMYGWYAAYYPLHAQQGFDLWDDDRDQMFYVNSEYASATSAITAMAGKAMQKADGTLFLAYHRNGSCGSGYHGGVVIQDGTQCLANNGKDHEYILHWYYDSSTTLSGQLLSFFTVL